MSDKLAKVNKKLIVAILIGVILLTAYLIYVFFGDFFAELYSLIKTGDQEKIAEYLNSRSQWGGYVALFFCSILQVVSIFIPGMKSAAALFDDTFENATEFNANNAEYVKDNDGTIKVPTSTTLDTLYKTLCVYEYNQNAGSISETITMTVNSKDIQASVTMDDSYNVTAVFTMTGSTRKVTSAINASPTTGNTPRERGNSVSFLPANITVQ